MKRTCAAAVCCALNLHSAGSMYNLNHDGAAEKIAQLMNLQMIDVGKLAQCVKSLHTY